MFYTPHQLNQIEHAFETVWLVIIDGNPFRDRERDSEVEAGLLRKLMRLSALGVKEAPLLVALTLDDSAQVRKRTKFVVDGQGSLDKIHLLKIIEEDGSVLKRVHDAEDFSHILYPPNAYGPEQIQEIGKAFDLLWVTAKKGTNRRVERIKIMNKLLRLSSAGVRDVNALVDLVQGRL